MHSHDRFPFGRGMVSRLFAQQDHGRGFPNGYGMPAALSFFISCSVLFNECSKQPLDEDEVLRLKQRLVAADLSVAP